MLGVRLVFLLCILLPGLLAAQSDPEAIRTDPNWEAEVLVREIFASGTCETITNIEAIGAADGLGFFDRGMGNVGLDRGIILSTGPVLGAMGPNSTAELSGTLPGSGGDPYLSALAQSPVYDAVGLEFDFVPLDSIISFRYVFASEEYCEFVGSQYNDVFGFFVEGPGLNGDFPNGAVNVATLPGSDQFVSINTINHLENSSNYRDNVRPADRDVCALPDADLPYLSQIEYDGFTVVLTAVLYLQPCQTYHLRMVVGDVSDGNYDSAVFLEAGSFDLGGEVSVSAAGAGGGAPTIYEGCSSGYFRFRRPPDSNQDFPLSVGYRIGGGSTAQAGLDFDLPAVGQVSIPSGADYVDLPVQAAPDNTPEGQEAIWLVLDIPCACYADSVAMTIAEPAQLLVPPQTFSYCQGTVPAVAAVVEGGVPPYTYQWVDGTVDSLWTPPGSTPAQIQVTVTDACGQMATRAIQLRADPPPAVQFTRERVAVCTGATGQLPGRFTGTPPFAIRLQRPDGSTDTLEFATSEFSFPAQQAGRYRILRVSDRNCAAESNARIELLFSDPVINATATPTSCPGEADGGLYVQTAGGLPPYSFSWSGGLPPTSTVTGLAAGPYGLTVTDQIGCTFATELRVPSPPPLEPIEADCEALKRGVVLFSPRGGTAPYRYTIPDYGVLTIEQIAALPGGSLYPLTIEDANGCTLFQPEFLVPQAGEHFAELPNEVPVKLGKPEQIQPRYFVPDYQLATVRWEPAERFDCPDCLEPLVSSNRSINLFLYLTDRYGCRDTLRTRLYVDGRIPVYAPTAFSPDGNGNNDRFLLFADLDQVVRIEELRIFDRWGNLVFYNPEASPNSPRDGWDGVFAGRRAPPGVYGFTARIILVDGTVRAFQGSFNLVR